MKRFTALAGLALMCMALVAGLGALVGLFVRAVMWGAGL